MWRLLFLASASAASVPATMRAWVAPSADPASFHYDANFPTPALGDLRAQLAGLPPDARMPSRRGLMPRVPCVTVRRRILR